jgi:hypothetical protein
VKKITVVISGLLLQFLLLGTTVYADPAEPWIATKNTTRINTSNPTEAATIASRTVWPATMKENRPGGIILTDPTNRAVALASLKLVHHPISGPVLFVDKNRIPAITLQESSVFGR